MGKARRVLVCGDSVALAGVATSLSLDPDCEVLSHVLPINRKELHRLHPDVVLFDLDAVPPSFVYAVSSQLPDLLLIGIDLETNRAMLWTERQAEGMSSQDLARVIHHKGVVYEPRLTAAHENVAAIDDANLDCSGECRAAIFKGESS
jgi:hypothetical protein